MNSDDLVTLNDEIAGMAKAGLPLDQGLAALAREMNRGRLQRATERIAADLKRGQTLPQALENQGDRVPRFYAALVKAAIRSGRLSEVLATLTLYARSMADLRSIVVGSLLYPGIVVVIAAVIFIGLTYFVVPQFSDIFVGFNLQLPAITVAVLWLAAHPEAILIPLLVIGGSLLVYRLIAALSEWGRLMWARSLYTVPVFGTMIRAARLASFSELLAILVDQAVPLPEAFRLAGEASSDPIMAMAAQQVQHDLNQGLPLATTLRERHLVPELVAWMTGFGEQRGELGSALHHVAELYRRQVEMRAALLRNVLPPFVIIFTGGVIVALFVFALMLPMLKLLQSLAK
jgi:type II secretory pathway component PulF